MSKVLIWLASGDKSKLMPGILWGTNARKYGWVDEVRFVVFGAAEDTIGEDPELFEQLQDMEGTSYCVHVAQEMGLEEKLAAQGAKLEAVGAPIAEYIKAGYQVLVF